MSWETDESLGQEESRWPRCKLPCMVWDVLGMSGPLYLTLRTAYVEDVTVLTLWRRRPQHHGSKRGLWCRVPRLKPTSSTELQAQVYQMCLCICRCPALPGTHRSLEDGTGKGRPAWRGRSSLQRSDLSGGF